MHKIRFGGDYNPEQWPADVWERDLELFKKACIDTLTVNVVPVDADLLKYEVVVAPLLHMVKGDFATRVEAFVAGGGTFVTSFSPGGSTSPTTRSRWTRPARSPGFSVFGLMRRTHSPRSRRDNGLRSLRRMW